MASEHALSVANSVQPTSSASTIQPLVTLKNKKVVFKQQPLGLDQALSTISERLNFHAYLQTVSETLKEFPVAHLSLIAKLVHESEETYHHAASRIHKLLAAQIPSASTDGTAGNSVLSKTVVDSAIRRVADRTNWGVENGISGATIWRLEVKDRGMLPPEFQQVCEERWKERNQAKLEIQIALSNMSEADRAQYIKSTATTVTSTDKDVVMTSPTKADKAESSAKKSTTRTKKPADSDNALRDKERLEKKTAKVEKEKKEAEVVKKSAAAFASFFTSARPAIARVKAEDVESSDYDKTFQSFVVKRNTVRTPVNRFTEVRAQLPTTGLSSSKDLLREFLESAPAKQRPSVPRSSRSQQNLEVRAIMNELNDAEVLGDSRTVRRLTALLKNRRALPAKLFHFHENNKPAYYGTWTKTPSSIRARRPFGKDESLDYDYDSDDDWEEEGEGEAIVSDGSDEDGSDSDSDEEGWLVGDDEVEVIPGEGTEELAEELPTKRGPELAAKNKEGKRRKVEKLAPFQKGPCWEMEIGQCSYEPFNAYRIQLLNDCPYPVNPFTFIPEPSCSATGVALANGSSTTQPAGAFAVPVPPTPANDVETSGPSGPSNRTTSFMRKPTDPTSIKNPFPPTHLPELYGLIEGSEKTLKGLVEDLYLALKRYPGVKKYAIEAKLREVADKGRSADAPNKRWRVSDEAWVAIGMTRPG
ncbi:hypothetical protein FRC08_013891 [Ceratobasidium sp. 394]|nr:hypothetical protein FRC08_013891 [Ceratobasidium sp. 394]KAG9102035.1 hypothetical protein FS749_000069 [Ceratobasidium sp. UAMH 11750]